MDYRERWEHKEYLSVQRLDRRVLLFHACIVILLLTFVLDFWNLQMVRGDEYARLAENNRLRRIPLDPTRGTVYDRHGAVLASTRPSLSLVLRREDDRDFEEQLERVAPMLGRDPEDLFKRLERMRSRPLYEPLVLVEDAGLRELVQVEARREWFPSLEVVEKARRSYPEAEIVAHPLGYVGEVSDAELASRPSDDALRSGDVIGKSGLERRYDAHLRGRPGWKFVSVNTLGRQLPLGPSRVGRAPSNGRELRLTLDLELQRVLRESLGDEAGAGVFMDPRTGEILAMASAPYYDPNLFAGGISHDTWKTIEGNPRRPLHDRAINSFYAPGSTFKVVLAAAGLETGTVDTEHRAWCNGSTRIYGRRFLCWKRGGHGWVDLRKALAESCNIYFYQLGQKLGVDRIHEYGARLGLGRPTGIDIPGERAGVLPSRAWKERALQERWYPGDTISVAIGQGLLTATPLQMATLISAVGTGSVPTPHLVLDSRAPSRPVALDQGTFAVIRAALADTVKRGTARSAAIEGIQVAGKTGTAQVYKHSAGVDSDKLPKAERDHAWFVGYAPAEHPTIAFAVVVEHGGHGGSSAGPVARKVLEAFFSGTPHPEPASPDVETAVVAAAGAQTEVGNVGTTASR